MFYYPKKRNVKKAICIDYNDLIKRGENMEEYINAKQLREMFNSKNPNIKMSMPKARKFLKMIREHYPDAILPYDNVIPKSWVDESLGTKKDTPQVTS